jgi:hypothetical protein
LNGERCDCRLLMAKEREGLHFTVYEESSGADVEAELDSINGHIPSRKCTLFFITRVMPWSGFFFNKKNKYTSFFNIFFYIKKFQSQI